MTGPRDDAAAERARLEAIAYGPGSTPAEAAHARIALADLAAGRRGRGSGVGREARPTSAATAAVDGTVGSGTGLEARPAATGHARVDGVDGVDGSGTGLDDRLASPPDVTADEAAGSDTASERQPVDGASAGALPRTGSTGAPETSSTADGAGDGASAGDRPGGASGVVGGEPGLQAGDRPSGASGVVGGEPGLQADDGRGHARFRWSARRGWLAAGAAAAVGLAFASGIAVGTVRPDGQQVAAPSPSDGAITVTQLLDAPQSFADRVPVPAGVPVVSRSTRLVFTNRSLSGDDAGTPWNVWAGVGKDRTQICFIASADRIESSGSCYPKDAVLAGQVLLTAQSSSGVLQVRVVDGVVRGTVTDGI